MISKKNKIYLFHDASSNVNRAILTGEDADGNRTQVALAIEVSQYAHERTLVFPDNIIIGVIDEAD